MKQKLLYLFLFLTISVSSFAQVANGPQVFEQCDEGGDGYMMFDLSFMDAQILGGQDVADFTVSYFHTPQDADANSNPLPIYYTNITNPQSIYARVTENSSENYDITTVNLVVNPEPSIFPLSALSLCDDSASDEVTVFDLTVKDVEVTNGNTDWSVAYYETSVDAQNQVNGIANATTYTNTSNPQTLFVAITDLNTGCLSFTTLTIRVLPNPSGAMGTPSDIVLCDDNNDGITTLDVTLNETVINPSGEPFTITYFSNEGDAMMNSAPILDPTNFTNVSNPQTIYVRVENLYGCYALTNFDIFVNPSPEIYLDSNYSFCAGASLTLDTGLNGLDYSFQWYYDGSLIPDETQASLMVNQPGNYEVSVISLLGCGTIITLINVEEVDCIDTDDDGVIDSDEDINGNGNLEDDDTDGDSIPNYLDSDDDGDGVDTLIEINIVLGRNVSHAFVDTDNDLVENYLDNDDDGDGVLTIDEDYNNNGDPTDDDTNSNGIPDYLENSVALNVDQFNAIAFQLYPNPAKGEVTIQLANANSGIGKINVFDIQGKMILKNIKLQVPSSILDISNLESGLYFVELTIGHKATVQKLIVN